MAYQQSKESVLKEIRRHEEIVPEDLNGNTVSNFRNKISIKSIELNFYFVNVLGSDKDYFYFYYHCYP